MLDAMSALDYIPKGEAVIVRSSKKPEPGAPDRPAEDKETSEEDPA